MRRAISIREALGATGSDFVLAASKRRTPPNERRHSLFLPE